MTTALLTHADALGHVTPPGHPEQVARLEYVLHALEGMDLMRVTAPMAAEDDLLRVHPESYLEMLRLNAPSEGFAELDPDTFPSPGSVEAAWRGRGGHAGGGPRGGGRGDQRLSAMRPPGHHAETETPMGFCLLGNAALAARHALDHHGMGRVAVVDFDVHHGNGTQDILWDEPNALFVSSHQMPLWPGTGKPDETGAYGNVMNVPLAPGTDGARMREVYTGEVFPRLRAFAPEMIVVSAGFDAHLADPLAHLEWLEEDFAWLTRELCALADAICGGRLVSVLEGGYDLEALARSARAHVSELKEAAG